MEKSSMPVAEVPVRLRAGGKESRGSVEIRYLTVAEQTLRGMLVLAGSWAAAAFSSILAIVNVVLMPFFFALGIVGFFWVRRIDGHFLKLNALCPSCAESLSLKENRPRVEWPFEVCCSHCQSTVVVRSLENSDLVLRTLEPEIPQAQTG